MSGCSDYMAKFTYSGFDEFFGKLGTVSAGSRIDAIAKAGLYDGADVMADAIKAAVPVDDGDLKASLFIQRFRNDEGTITTEIGFAGYDSGGVPNQMKANILESGTDKRPKHPFIRPTFNRFKEQSRAAIAGKIEEEITKIMEE